MRKNRNIIFMTLALTMALLTTAIGNWPPAVSAQTAPAHLQQDKNGRSVAPITPAVIYSPADLLHNAAVLPASLNTPATAIINVATVTKMTLFVNCTQAVTVQINVYDDQDVLYGTYNLFTAVASGAQQIYIASELAPNATSGTAAAAVRLPQKKVSFTELNGGATPGTCTDRVIVGY